jgi:hypothetical protein
MFQENRINDSDPEAEKQGEEEEEVEEVEGEEEEGMEGEEGEESEEEGEEFGTIEPDGVSYRTRISYAVLRSRGAEIVLLPRAESTNCCSGSFLFVIDLSNHGC